MASDPMQLFGLYLDMKRRKEESAQQKQALEMRQSQMRQDALARAIEVAVQTGDSKLATGLLEASQGGMSRMQDWELVDAAAKNARKQMKAKEEAREARVATPNAAAQTDLSRGLAAQLQAPGDPLRNAVEGIRGLPNAPPVVTNQLMQRAGGIVGEQKRASAEFDRRKIKSTEEWIRGQRATKGGGGGDGKPSDVEVNRATDRENATAAAWEKFQTSEMPWDEWIQEAPRGDVTAAMRSPKYVEMRRRRLKRPVGFANVETGASTGAESGKAKTVTTPSGKKVTIERID
jgi:hypothetical protein